MGYWNASSHDSKVRGSGASVAIAVMLEESRIGVVLLHVDVHDDATFPHQSHA